MTTRADRFARSRPAKARRPAPAALILALGTALALCLALAGPARAQLDPEAVVSALVKVSAVIPADAQSARTLGTEREGSGVVIGSDGLILTVGYLVLEANEVRIEAAGGVEASAEVIAYDQATGFGLLRARKPLGVKPLRLGSSEKVSVRDQVLVASSGGVGGVIGAVVASKRTFAGYWEYLLETALFTVPAHPHFAGAAMIGTDGTLLGIGSLFVGEALPGVPSPGNMFIPIDALKPIFPDLLATGRRNVPDRPWIGVNSQEIQDRVIVSRVTPGGPAASAGLKPGDIILKVGESPVTSLEDLYRAIWRLGPAGVEVPLTVLQGVEVTRIPIRSTGRTDWLKRRTY
ncbi:MAG: serine protease [Proteobacteria bacterium]|nr:serine protease [Pseudomonadota bacterium]